MAKKAETVVEPLTHATEVVALDTLSPHPQNYRVHPEDQIDHVVQSIKEHGFYRNVVIARDGTILAGHGAVLAARKMGMSHIPIVRLDVGPNDTRALKVLAGDNGIAHLAEDDDRALSEMLKQIKEDDPAGLLGTGYDPAMLSALVMITRPASEIADFDAAAEWAGMPDYDIGGKQYKLITSFDTQEARDEFVREYTGKIRFDKMTVGANLWSARWPYAEREDVANVKFEPKSKPVAASDEAPDDDEPTHPKKREPDIVKDIMLSKDGVVQSINKRLTPWVWSVELVRGCNLSCWHCPARIFPEDGNPRMMEPDTWEALCEVMAKMTPGRRLELAQCGEPTLHPKLLDYLRTVKRVSPTTQVQVTTNGLNIQNGNYNFRELFDAGANSVYVDMYAPFEKYQKLAEESGAEWYHYNRTGVGNTKRRANTYYGDPKMRLIILQDSPIDRIRWRKMGRLSTFLNHIDWPNAMPHGLVPVREPYHRKCTMPLRYVSTSWEGDYVFCCIDFWCETAGQLGNVKDGPGAFPSFWFGRLMQTIRRRIVTADRAGVPYCSRCNCAFSKCDWTRIWPENAYDEHWAGGEWASMPSEEHDDDVFADGWEKARSLAIPSPEDELACLSSSKKKCIINTCEATKCKPRD